jgi:hypothetical protein
MFVSAAMYLNALFLLLGDNSDRSRALVKEFLEVVDKTNGKKEIIGDEDDLISVYRMLIRSVIQENISQEDTSATKMLLLKLSTNETIKSHPLQRDLLTDVLTAADPVTPEQIDEYLKAIRNAVMAAEIDSNTRKLFARSRALVDIQDVDLQEEEIAKLKSMFDSSLKAIEHRESSAHAKASESYVSMSDADSLKRTLTKYMERSVTGVLKSGLQGLNRALGARGGIGLGESAVFAALSHHYKSGILLDWTAWTIEYNQEAIRKVTPPGKRALCYFISVENEVHQNVMIVFKKIYGRVTGKTIDVTNLSIDWATEWLVNHFKQFDIDLIIDRYNPHEFSFEKFVKRFNSFVDDDKYLVMFILDYLSEVKGIDPGDTMSAAGFQQLIAENYIKFCNHSKQLGYAFVTGHQLNRKAEDMAQDKGAYAVKRFNPSMVAESSNVFRPVDIFFFMLLVNNIDGHKFLTAINRKNRGNQDTPEHHKFFAYPFTPFGIMDDVGGVPGYVTDIDAYGSMNGERNEELVEGALF